MNLGTVEAAHRMVELAARWQDPALWKIAHRIGADSKKNQALATKDSESAEYLQKRGKSAKALVENALRCNFSADINLRDTAQNHSEFIELKNLVRQHIPTALEHVPGADFFTELSSQTTDNAIRDLKRLEGTVRAKFNEAFFQTNDAKPGPEFTRRLDARKNYFRVWDYVLKPGNKSKTPSEISKAILVNIDMVSRVLKKTRPPSSEELEQERKERKQR